MKTFKLNLIISFTLLLFASSLHLQAQKNMDVEIITKDDKVTIIKKYTDENGVKTVEKIVKDIDEINDVEKELMVIEGMDNLDIDVDIDGKRHHNFNFEFDEDGEHNVFEWDGDGESLDKMILKLKEKGMSLDFDFDGDHTSFFSYDNKEDEAFLGVVIGEYGPNNQGIYIENVVGNSAAEAAGLRDNDMILSIDDEPINSFSDLSDKLDEYKPGDNIAIVYVRSNASATTNATLKTRERFNIRTPKTFSISKNRRDPCKPFIGVYLHSGHNERGVKITDVIDNTPASEVGMEAGDYITAIDGVPVTSHRHTLRERDKHQAGDFFTITFTRDGRSQEVEAQFPPCGIKEEPTDKIKEVTPAETPNLNTSPTIKQVNIPDNTLQLDGMGAYPNPTTGKMYVQFRAEAAPVMITVTDMLGREILKEEIADFDGFYNKELNLKDATPGTLLLNIFQNNKVFTEKIIKTGAY